MHQLRYMTQAKNDLLEIKRFIRYESGNPNVAIKFIRKLRNQCIKLSGLPGQIGQLRPELGKDIRSFAYGNYIIFFRYNSPYLDIITIIERHRDIEALF